MEAEKMRGYKVEEYFYPTREIRDIHVEHMESLGWECSGQIKYVFADGENWRWYAKFSKWDTE